MIAHPPDRRLYLFFSRRNNDRAHARQTTVSFFISGRNKTFPPQQKTANFPPEPKTDTTAQPARRTTVSFFSGRNKTFPPQQNRTFFPVVSVFVLRQSVRLSVSKG